MIAMSTLYAVYGVHNMTLLRLLSIQSNLKPELLAHMVYELNIFKKTHTRQQSTLKITVHLDDQGIQLKFSTVF